MSTVDLSRVPVFYHRYINLVKDAELNEALQNHQDGIQQILEDLPENKWNYRYAEGKWSIRELVQHLIDAERIFCYRALRFSRKDTTPLPGFDENLYADTSGAERRSTAGLLEELGTVQKSTAQLFASFDEEQLNQSGEANGNSIYVKAIGFIIAGHTLHHANILKERYL
jgi:hypothetical protein